MRSWPDNVTPPTGWEVNDELSRKYGHTIITEERERSRIVRGKRATMQLFEALKNEGEEKRRRRVRLAGGLVAGGGAAGVIWKASRDRGGADHYEAVTDDHSRKEARRGKAWLDKNRSKFAQYEGANDKERARAWAKQTGEKLHRSLEPGAREATRARKEAYGKFLGRRVPGGHKGGESFGKDGRKSYAGSYKSGKFKRSILSNDLLSWVGKRTKLPGSLIGIPEIKHPRPRKS